MKPFERITFHWRRLGPGLVTGSSDDDPSGIATYSQAGAAFGLNLLWTSLFTFPLMVSIQEMSARIGLVTSKGLAAVIKKYYSKVFLFFLVLLIVPAIIFNIGADIASMGAVSHLLFPSFSANIFSLFFTLILLLGMIFFSYQRLAAILKWLCLSLVVYLFVPFLVKLNWVDVLKGLVLPTLSWDREFLAILVAILGTTISPYLFFWQTSMSVEDRNHKNRSYFLLDREEINEMNFDIKTGMFFSNVVMFFIILTTGSVLHSAGIRNIRTVEEASLALQPLAGDLSFLLFSLGIIGTGCLAIPVLAGTLSYILSDLFEWEQGMSKKFYEAKAFYTIMVLSMLIGLGINFVGLDPIKALIYTAIAYGLTAPFFIGFILHICNSEKIMGDHRNKPLHNFWGICTFLIMALSGIALIFL